MQQRAHAAQLKRPNNSAAPSDSTPIISINLGNDHLFSGFVVLRETLRFRYNEHNELNVNKNKD